MNTHNNIPIVNAHLHTPYSFSAFDKLTDALDLALDERVQVVGINDFYTTEGYAEWDREARKRNIYPLFNIELISLQKEAQENNIRINDPNNPGRIYISGKGLRCPSNLPEPYKSQLTGVCNELNTQVKEMCEKLNASISTFNAGFSLDFNSISCFMTKGLIRERHLAKAFRMMAYMHLNNEPGKIKHFLEKVFNGKPLHADIFDYAGVETEIRNNLLKAGGIAFVPEEPKAFLPLENIHKLIIAGGGIPTFPFLADNANGSFTEFENDIVKAAEDLKQKHIFSAEFVTTRNSIEALEKYAGYLYENGFIVTFGTEHNTPKMEPLTPFARNNTPLSERLKQISYNSACVIAAHQERIRKDIPGYIDNEGIADINSRDTFIKEGDELIKNIIKN